MSDDDDFMMDDAGDEDYDFDYEDDDDAEEEGDAGLENKYYLAKNKKEDDLQGAIAEFKAIVEQEQEKGDWGFKALKQLTKLYFLHLHEHALALQTYTQLLTYTRSAVTRNYSEKSINGILDYVSGETRTVDLEVMERFYDVTMRSLAEMKNERLSVKTNLKLAKLWLDRKEYGRLQKTLRDLRASCQSEDGTDDQSKGTLLLEIYALEIQMASDTGDTKKAKEIYNLTLSVTSAIPHPRIMGVIREAGGKINMGEKQWEQAQIDFFESFRSYDEAGSPQRKQVLKYLVLAHMLMGSEIDPFDSQETKPYKDDADILPMTQLVAAYQRREVHEAEKIIRKNRSAIMDDPFIRHYIDDVLRALRTSYLVDLIKPYSRMDLAFLGKQLNVDVEEVENLLVALILDGKVQGRIDSVNQRIELDRHKPLEARRYAALASWTAEMEKMHALVVQKVAGMQGGGGGGGGGAGGPGGMGPMGGMGMGGRGMGFGGPGGWGGIMGMG